VNSSSHGQHIAVTGVPLTMKMGSSTIKPLQISFHCLSERISTTCLTMALTGSSRSAKRERRHKRQAPMWNTQGWFPNREHGLNNTHAKMTERVEARQGCPDGIRVWFCKNQIS